MNTTFEANRLRPGDAGYQYNVERNFTVGGRRLTDHTTQPTRTIHHPYLAQAVESSGWDDEDDEAANNDDW
jgi:hypothetical protein